ARSQTRTAGRPRRPGDRHRRAGPRRERDIVAQQLAARQAKIEPGDIDALSAALDRDRLLALVLRGDPVDPAAEPGEPADHRLVLGDLGVARDDERKRFLDRPEGRDHLHQTAERDLLLEVAGRGYEE